MANEISQVGFGHTALQNVQNSTININQQLGKSVEYQSLINQLNTSKELLIYIPENEVEKRLLVSKQINDLENSVEKFKSEVLELARHFERIDVNTERLQKAKELFDNGKINEATAFMKASLEVMQNEQNLLLAKKAEFESEYLPKLKHNSDEFLTLALVTQYDYENPKHFIETCSYFEKSIESHITENNLYLYACFLMVYNVSNEAAFYFEKHLKKFAHSIQIDERIEVLDYLASAYFNLGDYKKAALNFEEALILAREEVSKKKTEHTLSLLSTILTNIGLFHIDFSDYGKAMLELLEALRIKRKLAEAGDENYLKGIAIILCNLGLLNTRTENYERAEMFYSEALEIHEKLADSDIFSSLPSIALIHLNLGDLYGRYKEAEVAEKEFIKALDRYETLMEVGILHFIPEHILTLRNLAALYFKKIPNRETSTNAAFTGIMLGLRLHESNNFVKEEVEKCVAILNLWGISQQEIQHSIDETIATMQETQTELENSPDI